MVIMLELCYRQKVILVILLLIHKQLEVLVKFLINILCFFLLDWKCYAVDKVILIPRMQYNSLVKIMMNCSFLSKTIHIGRLCNF